MVLIKDDISSLHSNYNNNKHCNELPRIIVNSSSSDYHDMTGYWNMSKNLYDTNNQVIGNDMEFVMSPAENIEDSETSDFSGITLESTVLHQLNKIFDNSLLLQGLCGVIVLCMSILWSSSVTLIPQTNIILYPEYWYEPLGPTILGYLSVQCALTGIDCSLVMNVDIVNERQWKIFLKLFFASTLGFVVPYISIYFIWTSINEQRHPMPFVGQICAVIAYIMKVIAFWFIFPHNLRVNNKQFRKRLINYMILFPLYSFFTLGYSNLSMVFFAVPQNIQWCLGIVVPCLKKFNIWLSSKFALKAAGGKRTLHPTLAVIMGVGITHSLAIVLLLGSKVKPLTTYLIIILDSIPNVWSCIKLIKQRKTGRLNDVCQISTNRNFAQERNPALVCLTLKEFLELSIPAVYCASFLMAYYGPNAKVLGNVKNDYWQFEKVENVFDKLSSAGLFFCIDALRATIFALILWFFSDFNMLETYCYIAHRYGFVMFLYISGALVVVNMLLSFDKVIVERYFIQLVKWLVNI